jgi:hypothetical protein
VPSDLRPVRLAAESFPIAGIVLLWALLGAVAGAFGVGDSVRAAGTVMGALYAVVRGVALARTLGSPVAFDDAAAVLRVNVTVLLPAGVWFLAGMVVGVLDDLTELVRAGTVSLAFGGLDHAFETTGVLTVVLGAVAVGYRAVIAERPRATHGQEVGDG